MTYKNMLARLLLSAALGAAAAPALAQDSEGTLVVAIESLAAQNLDPILEGRPGHAHYHAPLYDALVGFDLKEGGIGPGIAERWQISEDGESWTFYLRDGLTFHNGEALTAEDVKFSIERIMSEESITAQAAAFRRIIKDIEVVDDLTVRFVTDGIQVYFPTLFSRAIFHDGTIMPKDYFEEVGADEFRRNPVGSGPWKFVRSVPGDLVEYEAVEHAHWRGKPKFKRLVIMQVPEQSTRMAMVRSGEAAIAAITPEAIREVRDAGLKLVSVPGTAQALYQFYGLFRDEMADSPLRDPRVREALSLAIDRKAIIEHIMEGEARMPLPFATFGYSLDMDVDRWRQWAQEALRYDPERARELLAEAGYKDGFTLGFANTALPGTPWMVDVGLVLADFWSQVGVNVDLQNYEWGAFRPLTQGDQPELVGRASMYRTAGRPIATTRYHVAFHPEGAHRLIGNADKCDEVCQKYVELNEAIEVERDDVKRAELTDQMIELTTDTWMAVPILEAMGYWAVNPELVGAFEPIPGRHELGDVFERMPRPDQKPWE
jgi:peptide/nickel transport system substrate-binding protein